MQLLHIMLQARVGFSLAGATSVRVVNYYYCIEKNTTPKGVFDFCLTSGNT